MEGKFRIYQLMPRTFGCRKWTEGGSYAENGSGKLADITDRCLAEWRDNLAIDAVWFTGVIAHATKTRFKGCTAVHPDLVKGEAGSPYAITDYFDVAPELTLCTPCDDGMGGEAGAAEISGYREKRLAEFDALVSRTHRAGLKVIIDFVPNHIFRQYNHPFSVENFYHLHGQPLRLPFETTYEESPALGTGNNHTTATPSVCDWYDTVKLNYENKYTWNLMLSVLLFWAGRGVDGFRCDMVELVPSDFFGWAFSKVREVHPETFFIAEVYDKNNYRHYAGAGFDFLYDKSGFYDALRDISLGRRPAYWLTDEWQFTSELQPRMLNFLENHDEQRIASDFFLGDGHRAIAPLAVSLLFNIAPFMLYAGQEYGERGMNREGYSGLDGKTSIYDYCTLSPERDMALYGRYKELLSLSRDDVFSKGGWYDLMFLNRDNPNFNPASTFAFMRGYGGRGALVVANFADTPADVRVNINDDCFACLGIPRHTDYFEMIHIAPHDAAVIIR